MFHLNRVREDCWHFRYNYPTNGIATLTDKEVVQLRAEIDRAWEEGKKQEQKEVNNGFYRS